MKLRVNSSLLILVITILKERFPKNASDNSKNE